MSLAQKIAQQNSLAPCKLGSLMKTHLPPDDVDYLESVLYTPVGDVKRISTQTLLNAIREEGYSIGISTVERHRLQVCNCFRK